MSMIESSNGRKDFISQGRSNNFFISIAPRKKFEGERKFLSFPKEASTSDCGDSHIVSVEVRTTLETKQLVTEDV